MVHNRGGVAAGGRVDGWSAQMNEVVIKAMKVELCIQQHTVLGNGYCGVKKRLQIDTGVYDPAPDAQVHLR